VWQNSLAADKPIYNADFTEMTVKLRSGIYWSDGVEFTSDDAVFTAELHLKTNGMRWSAPFQINVASVSAPDKNTVVFKLKKPNSRFHALFTVRWNAVWMMPKHVFEKVADPLKFDFNKRSRSAPTSCTATIRMENGSSGRCARIGNARRSAATARRDRNMSRMLIRARPTNA